MSNLMCLKLTLAILLGGVAASAVVFYFWDEEINKFLDEDINRKLLEKCFRRNYANNDRKN